MKSTPTMKAADIHELSITNSPERAKAAVRDAKAERVTEFHVEEQDHRGPHRDADA